VTTAYPLRIRKSKDLIAVLAVTFLTLGIAWGPNHACFVIMVVAVGVGWFWLIRRYPSWSVSPGIIAGRRNLQDAGHRANGIHGLVRAPEPVNPFGLALLSRANQAAAFAWMSRS
jgi:hypothetical protein